MATVEEKEINTQSKDGTPEKQKNQKGTNIL